MFLLSRKGLRFRKLTTSIKRLSTNPPLQNIEIFINNEKVLVRPGTTILQAALSMGIEIPRFCYHDKLSIAGNCRMCLVEVEKIPKPVASCAMPAMNGWRIHTNSDMCKKARESVMEFLLINHPLDCPICDQGGECDLQDQSMSFGNDKSRFIESDYTGKRAVENKYIGPLVKTIMTRCIHCTRCIRFMTEIAGVEDLGSTGRGSDMQIGTYLEKMLCSELSGNIIDVCPVGALTSRPNQFAHRPWEMRKFNSVDVSDAVGSNIVVGVRTSDVVRVLPMPNDEINEAWISDKARFMYDGLKYQRLMVPLQFIDNKFEPIDWLKALTEVSARFIKASKNSTFAVAGQLNDAESLMALRDLFHMHNCDNLFTEDTDHPTLNTGIDFRCSYTMNNSIRNIENCDVLLLVGICPRYEAPLINAKIRKSFIHNKLKILLLGAQTDLNYTFEHIGNDSSSLDMLIKGKHPMSHIMNTAKRPLIFMGTHSAKDKYGASLLQKCLKFSNALSSKLEDKSWNVFNVIQRHAGYVGALDLGYNPGLPDLKKAEFLYLLGTDGGVLKGSDINPKCFVVYQGHHGDMGAKLADIVLPGSAYTEKSGTYVNTEGRAQLALRCVTSPGESREDWKIIRAISEVIGNPLKYDNLDDLRIRLSEIAPHFSQIGNFNSPTFQKLVSETNQNMLDGEFSDLRSHVENLVQFYTTNVISRHSKTMLQCSKEASKYL